MCRAVHPKLLLREAAQVTQRKWRDVSELSEAKLESESGLLLHTSAVDVDTAVLVDPGLEELLDQGTTAFFGVEEELLLRRLLLHGYLTNAVINTETNKRLNRSVTKLHESEGNVFTSNQTDFCAVEPQC